MASVSQIPSEALRWLTGSERSSVLLIGASGGYASYLSLSGHTVTVVDTDQAALTRLAKFNPSIHVVAARAESLPFDPCCFSLVMSIQNFHTFAPGLALGEWARVLRPHGRIGLAYLTRDDQVPWVKKLRRIIQETLPEAMTADSGADSVAALATSSYFPEVEKVHYRLWVPSTREGLQDSARQATGSDSVEPEQLEAMVSAVGQLYDDYARVPDPLLLPYQISCWRAQVDQSDLTGSLIPGDDGLSISL